MKLLQDQYNIDLSQFCFDRYFPQEFPGRNVFAAVVWMMLSSFLPFHPSYRNNFQPLTLSDMERAIRTKQLS